LFGRLNPTITVKLLKNRHNAELGSYLNDVSGQLTSYWLLVIYEAQGETPAVNGGKFETLKSERSRKREDARDQKSVAKCRK
jgi:hypothetical protein